MELPLADKLYSSNEVCQVLGVSLRTLYRYIESGNLDSIQTPTGRHRFTKRHIEDFLGKGKKEKPYEAPVREEEKEVPKEEVKEEKEEKSAEGLSSLAEEEVSSPTAEPKEEEGSGEEELVEEVSEIYYKADAPDVRQLAKNIKETADKNNLRYAFTGLGGLSLHFPIKPFSNLDIYVQKGDLDKWISELDLTEATKLSANLLVRFNDSVLDTALPLGGLIVASNEALIKDLGDLGHKDLASELKAKVG